MTTKYPCYIEFTDSGHFARLVWSGRAGTTIIAEFLISDDHLMQRAAAAHDRLGLQDIPRPSMHYRGEIHEIIDPEIIQEEINELQAMMSEDFAVKGI
jgi:hypothetical protein